MSNGTDRVNQPPLAVELFAGTGSGTAGWCELGGRAVGFDLEYLPHHGKPHERSYRVIQDVLTLHGSQFKDAAFIWASPPCQKYSYLAMPWSRSKPVACECRELMMALPEGTVITGSCRFCGGSGFIEHSKAAKALRKKWETEGPDNRLFDACFRIQREASEAAGHYIPMIVENVRGAIPWVGPSKANYGSFHLWGDVAQVGRRIFCTHSIRFGAGLLVPSRLEPKRAMDDLKYGVRKLLHDHLPVGNGPLGRKDGTETKVPGFRFDGSGRSFQTASVEAHGTKVPGQIQGKEYAMCRTGAAGQKTLGVRDGHGRDDARDVESGGSISSDGLGHEHGGTEANGGFLVGMGNSGRAIKTPGRSLSKGAKNKFGTHNMGSAEEIERELGTKIGGDWFSDPNSTCRKHGSKSNARKAASALIARIPYALSRYIAEQFYPRESKGYAQENSGA